MTLHIHDLSSGDAAFLEQVAQLLVDGFRDTGSRAWRHLDEARDEVMQSLQPGRISRVAVDEAGHVVGWIGGIEEYDGHVWELHPLVVEAQHRRQGVGRALVEDFEAQVIARGAHTVRLGADDEDDRTSVGGVDLYPDVLERLRAIESKGSHPLGFYLRMGYVVVGAIPDANGFGRPDILMAKRIRKEHQEAR